MGSKGLSQIDISRFPSPAKGNKASGINNMLETKKPSEAAVSYVLLSKIISIPGLTNI